MGIAISTRPVTSEESGALEVARAAVLLGSANWLQFWGWGLGGWAGTKQQEEGGVGAAWQTQRSGWDDSMTSDSQSRCWKVAPTELPGVAASLGPIRSGSNHMTWTGSSEAGV